MRHTFQFNRTINTIYFALLLISLLVTKLRRIVCKTVEPLLTGSLVHTTVYIAETFVTKKCMLTILCGLNTRNGLGSKLLV